MGDIFNNEGYTMIFGCKPSPKDLRDYKIANLSQRNITYPDYFILDNLPQIKNQRSINSCVAHAMSSILEYHDKSVHTLSTNFIYGIQHKLFNRDSEGMYLSDACKIAKSYGDMLESECKGNTEVPECYEVAEEAFNDTTKLSHSKTHIIESYFNCNSDEEIKYALITYGPVLISIKWMNNWSFDRNTGYLTERKVDRIEPLGYHAIMLIGWNEDGWICQNSWGKSFGNCGRFVIPYSVTIEEAKGIKDSSVGDDTNSEDIIVPKTNFILNYLYKLLNIFINGINNIVRYFIKSKLS